jgi:hypothetical protein
MVRSWQTGAVPSGRVVVVVMTWTAAALAADRVATPTQQLVLGAASWVLLLWLLVDCRPLIRVQTAVVVAFATVVEYVFSGWLEVYVYRLDHVPAYVPPGHGLVYLAALAIGGLEVVRRHEQALVMATTVAVVTYATYGVSPWAARPDMLGAFWAACLLLFLWRGRSPGLFVGAFVVVTYLELIGTRWQVWTWGTQDPTGLVPIGNPPSGAAGGYGWFDLAAVLAAPTLLAAWRSVARLRPWRAQGVQDVVVQQTVGAHRVAPVQGS